MSNRTTKAFWLTPLTNLHPGSGDTNYGIIDKEVQRDMVEGIPVIHASSLKGSFRELLEVKLGKDSDAVKYIFGDGHKSQEQNKNATGNYGAGHYHFYQARLLTLPVRSNAVPFFSATSPALIKAFLEELSLFLGEEMEESLKVFANKKIAKGNPEYFDINNDLQGKVFIEDAAAQKMSVEEEVTAEAMEKICALLGENLVLFNHEDFKQLCRDLPVIARNNLENGISQNLWYEEVVPRHSRFYFFISYPEKVQKGCGFITNMKGSRDQVQVGGNATIGYGLCKMTSIKLKTN